MATSNKPTAVHFTAAILGMTTLILAVTTYLGYKERSDAVTQASAAEEAKNKADSDLSNKVADIQQLKKDLGYTYDQVGSESPPPPNTVRGQLKEDIAKYGKDLEEPTVAATLASMRSTINQLQKDLAEKERAMQDVNTRMLALQGQYQGQMDKIQESQTDSETNLQNTIAQRDEILGQKEQEISAVKADYNRELVEKEQLRAQKDRQERDLKEQIANLTITNDRLREQNESIKNVSFEVPDGEIRNVDNTTRTVWLNLGKDDGIRSQVTFSVYDQNHHGVARGGGEDIKGSVEVVRVLGPHLSEARITSEQLNRPLSPGDVVYSPIWTPGLIEEFAIVGEVDIDGDERSDRRTLHDLIQNAGAKLALEVDDEGNRIPPEAQLNANIKFLIRGHIPDPSLIAANDPNQPRIRKMYDQWSQLETAANQQGIRVVRLNDFLTYLGYKPNQRLFVPGSDSPFTLKAGSRSTGVAETIGRTGSSSGNTSELYNRNRSGRGIQLNDN